jgi:hypothetical protein
VMMMMMMMIKILRNRTICNTKEDATISARKFSLHVCQQICVLTRFKCLAANVCSY